MSSSDNFSFDVGLLQQYKRDEKLCDIWLIGDLDCEPGDVKSKPISAHRIILELRSSYFLNLLSCPEVPTNPLHVREVPHQILNILIEYIYAGLSEEIMVKLTDRCRRGSVNEVMALLNASKKLMLTEVMAFCGRVLYAGNIHIENCLNYFRFGTTLTSSSLIDKAVDFLVDLDIDNFIGLTRLEDFLMLDNEIIHLLLPRLTYPPRISLEMIINWWKYDGQRRKEFGVNFLKTLDWTQIKDETLSEILFNNQDDQFKLVMFEPLVLLFKNLVSQQQEFPLLDDFDIHDDNQLTYADAMQELYSGSSQEFKSLSPETVTLPPPPSNFSEIKIKKDCSRPYVDLGVTKEEILHFYLNSQRVPSTTNQPNFNCTIYFIGETSTSGNMKKYSVQSFDLYTGETKILNSIMNKHKYSSLVYYDESIYVIGGLERTRGNKLTCPGRTQILDLIDDGSSVWRNVQIPVMPIPRYDFQSIVLNDKIYAIGGATPLDNSNVKEAKYSVVSTILQFDTEKGWTPLNDYYNDRVRTHTKCGSYLALVGDKIYSFGGTVSESDNQMASASNVVECFDSVERICFDMARMPRRLVGVAAAVLGSKVYVVGGGKSIVSRSSRANVYDTEKDSWTSIKSMNKPRACGTAVSCNGFIFAIGASGTIERYDPDIDHWEIWRHKLPPGDFGSIAYNITEG